MMPFAAVRSLKSHNLPDELVVTKATLKRIAAEAADSGSRTFFALLQLRNGSFQSYECFGIELDETQMMFSRDLIGDLNRELHHDGAWLIVWSIAQRKPKGSIGKSTEFRKFTLLWMDRDGDIAFPIECERSFDDYLAEGIHAMMAKCEQAYFLWLEAMNALALTPDETFKRAQGQEAPSERAKR
jgi:hypothetical protein